MRVPGSRGNDSASRSSTADRQQWGFQTNPGVYVAVPLEANKPNQLIDERYAL